MDLETLVERLNDPSIVDPDGGGPIEIVRTHLSVLLLGGGLVHKFKKPARFDFVDHSTLEKRRLACEAEVRLNRRLAPETYLGVVAIRLDGDGRPVLSEPADRWADDGGTGPGDVVEYAVRMVRLPAERMLEAILDRGAWSGDVARPVVERLAAFHAACPTGAGIDEHGDPETVERRCGANLDELDGLLEPAGAGDLGPLLPRLRAAFERWFERERPRLAERVRRGRVREGHGDLHAGNVCLPGDRVVIYDCIEFSRPLRCCDVACELSFLAMDLDRRGDRSLARSMLRAYADAAGDPELPELTTAFRMHLAMVRAKVALLRAGQLGAAERRDAAVEEARDYTHLAAGYTIPPVLVVTCGLPGTGKSFAARAIARPLGAEVIRSDVVRKELAAAADPPATGAALYTESFSERTVEAVRSRAAEILAGGRSVVIDATARTARQRAVFAGAAGRLGIPWLVAHVTAPEDLVRRRMAERAGDDAEVSDADWAVHERMKRAFESPAELDPDRVVALESPRSPAGLAGAVIERLAAVAPIELARLD